MKTARCMNRAIPIAMVMALLLSACQMPSYSPPSSSQGSSGSSGGASGGGSSSPSGSSGGSSGGDQQSGAGDSGGGESEGQESGGGNAGGPEAGDGEAGGQEGQEASGSQGSSGSGESMEDLDQALENSLEGFDDAVGSSGKSSDEIDILSPSGGSGVQNDSDELLFEEATEGGMAKANADIEKRAAEGSGEESPGEEGSVDAQGAPPGQPGAASGSAGSAGEQGEALPIPEDIDDGRGDDIVQRQIRDAAMKETDPVLREKLWDEYRRIKNQ